MKLGGLQKTSLVDYPGKISTTVFTKGCNFRCPFCHNSELVNINESKKNISENDFFDFLNQRSGFLDGVCITGGEPLIQKNIINFIKNIKEKNFLVKLDTNGSQPKTLEKLLERDLVDYIAMDIKSSRKNYHKLTNQKVNLTDISQSIELIKTSNKNYEFRTTVIPTLIDAKEIKAIGEWVGFANRFALQQFESGKTLNKSWKNVSPYPDDKLKDFVNIAKKYFQEVELRGL